MRRYRRYSDRDTHLGPYITFSLASETFKHWSIVLDSGDGDEYPGCSLQLAILGYTLIIELPQIIQPWVNPAHSWDKHSREYGFRLHQGFLQVFLGPQTHDSVTTRIWCKSLPWLNWRLYRDSLFGRDGEHVFSHHHDLIKKGAARYEEWRIEQDACPGRTFWFADYDGERIRASARIEEHELRFGTGWFTWLSLFRAARIRRSLSITFSAEVGPEKGSWKGGTVGHGIDMLPGELHEAAFKRYCAENRLTYYFELDESDVAFSGAAGVRA